MLRSKLIIFVIAGAISFAVYHNYTFFRERYRPFSKPLEMESGISQGREYAPEQGSEDWKQRSVSPADRTKFTSGMGRDPFRLAGGGVYKKTSGSSSDAAGLPQWSAVLFSPKRRLALMNGGIYQEGDRVSGRMITKIEQDRVTLSGGGDGLVVEIERSLLRESLSSGEDN